MCPNSTIVIATPRAHKHTWGSCAGPWMVLEAHSLPSTEINFDMQSEPYTSLQLELQSFQKQNWAPTANQSLCNRGEAQRGLQDYAGGCIVPPGMIKCCWVLVVPQSLWCCPDILPSQSPAVQVLTTGSQTPGDFEKH